jgi:hypothetical protein
MNAAMSRAIVERLMQDIDALLYWLPLVLIMLILFLLTVILQKRGRR